MSEHVPSGFYRDGEGRLKRERRHRTDRRNSDSRSSADGDRRYQLRRAADREFIEREHHAMIEEALAQFAEEHESY